MRRRPAVYLGGLAVRAGDTAFPPLVWINVDVGTNETALALVRNAEVDGGAAAYVGAVFAAPRGESCHKETEIWGQYWVQLVPEVHLRVP